MVYKAPLMRPRTAVRQFNVLRKAGAGLAYPTVLHIVQMKSPHSAGIFQFWKVIFQKA